MDWAKIAPEFEFDGSWRDIYVDNAGPSGWAAVWKSLSRRSPTPILSTSDYSGPMPSNPERLRPLFGGQGHLGVTFGDVVFNCHFFDESEIEFDFDPRSVATAADVEAVVGFLSLLGQATAKEVLLTWENAKAAVIARYDPASSQVVWSPAR